MTSCAITDHGVMYGVIEFYKEAKKQGINPILGCEVYVAPGSRFEKNTLKDRYYHLVLLAENNTGYQNLMKLVSLGFTEGFYYKPRIDKEILKKYHEGIIALSACLGGDIPVHIIRGEMDKVRKSLQEYLDIFGKENFFLEIQDHGIPDEKTVISTLLSLSSEFGIPLVATNDVHYTIKEDTEAHDILLCIQDNKKFADPNRMRYEANQYYVKSEKEMKALFPYAKEAIENTAKIAERCHVNIEFGITKVPSFPVPAEYDTWSYLNMLCHKGLKERYGKETSENIILQLNYELSVIKKMGYVEYFLIVWDYINWCRQQGIPVGPGRGSAAGSLVSYCMYITDIDPIKYGLLFERFLNPERISMPDIDVDFCYERRQEVIEYVKNKYGKENVCQIITFGTLAARNAIKDVGRALDFSYSVTNELSQMIPRENGITIEKALSMNPELKHRYDTDNEVRKLINMSMKLEGLPKNISTHAAGVVICQKPAYEFIPLAVASDNSSIVSQFNMTTIEELGLLKMDFLGLKTLTVISNTLKNIQRTTGKNISIRDIDLNDKEVLDFIGTGKTDGVFQLESTGMKGFMKELRPRSLEDIIAGISLYRPGPMDFIPKYIKGKNNPESITYVCKQLKPILEPTYGCIVYQEQVMQIVRDLALYTMGQADNIRRAMSKKKQYVIEEERTFFIYGDKERHIRGCINNGISKEAASEIYDSMLDFAKYAFNKSHAACYAVIAMQTAWLKYYYPVEYMAALLTSVYDKPDKLMSYIHACKSAGIELLQPDINLSTESFSVEQNKIRFSLAAIKSAGISVIENILHKRALLGSFKDFYSFLTEAKSMGVDKSCVESMIKAGAFDSLGGNRNQFLHVYEKALNSINNEKKNTIEGQISLFDMENGQNADISRFTLPDISELDREILLSYEKQATGVYINGHPLDKYVGFIDKYSTCSTSDFIYHEEMGSSNLKQDENISLCGILRSKSIKYTKKNQIMAFISVEDLEGTVDVIIFPKVYEKCSHFLNDDSKIVIKGKVSLEESKDSKIIADGILLFSQIPKNIWIKTTKEKYETKKTAFTEMFACPGIHNIIFYFYDTGERKMCRTKVDISEENLKIINALFGEDNIKIIS